MNTSIHLNIYTMFMAAQAKSCLRGARAQVLERLRDCAPSGNR